MRAEALLGEGEGAFVFGADGLVEQPAVAQAHLGGHVTEQRHQRLQRHSGVDQGGGVGVPELVAWSRGRARRLAAARSSSSRTAFWDSRRPWWVNRNWAGRPVAGVRAGGGPGSGSR